MKSTLKFGLLTGLISSAFLFGLFPLISLLNVKHNWGLQEANIRGVLGLLSIPIQAIGIFLSMQDVKRLTGALTYGQALKTGLIVAIIVAIMLAVFTFIYCLCTNPGYTDAMVKDAQKTMIANGETPEQIKKNSFAVAQEFSAPVQVMQAFVGQLVTGILITLVIGLFLKSKKGSF